MPAQTAATYDGPIPRTPSVIDVRPVTSVTETAEGPTRLIREVWIDGELAGGMYSDDPAAAWPEDESSVWLATTNHGDLISNVDQTYDEARATILRAWSYCQLPVPPRPRAATAADVKRAQAVLELESAQAALDRAMAALDDAGHGADARRAGSVLSDVVNLTDRIS